MSSTERYPPAPSTETREGRGADLQFVRPNDHLPMHNPIAMNLINLCPHNSQDFSLLRPSNDADPLFLRHFRSLLSNNPPTVSSLLLCALAELPSVITPRTTHRLPPTTLRVT